MSGLELLVRDLSREESSSCRVSICPEVGHGIEASNFCQCYLSSFPLWRKLAAVCRAKQIVGIVGEMLGQGQVKESVQQGTTRSYCFLKVLIREIELADVYRVNPAWGEDRSVQPGKSCSCCLLTRIARVTNLAAVCRAHLTIVTSMS